MSDKMPSNQSDYDPRPVTDEKVREEHSRDEIQQWRDEAQKVHNGWMDVMKNRYGKD